MKSLAVPAGLICAVLVHGLAGPVIVVLSVETRPTHAWFAFVVVAVEPEEKEVPFAPTVDAALLSSSAALVLARPLNS